MPGTTWGKPGFCGCHSHRAGRMLCATGCGTARRVLPISPAEMGSQEKFTLPGPSPMRESMARGAELSSEAGLAACRGAWPPPTVHCSVSVAGSQRWGGSSMFQPEGWEEDGACPGPRQQPPHILTEPPSAAAPCLSTPRPGILRWPCQDGSRYEKRLCQQWPLRASRAGAHAPSLLKNARFRRQHPFCKPQPKQPGVNHGQDGARSMEHGPTAAGFEDDATLTHLFF